MKKNILFLLLIPCMMVIGFQSGCKKMDDTYRQFIEDGETIYISKADSLILRGGDERMEVSWLLLSDPKVTNYKLFWNNRRDSLEGLLKKTEEVDTVKIMIDDLAEGVYEFEIFLYDDHGNSSIKASKIGRVYGQQYQNNRYNRLYRSITRVNGGSDLEINWLAPETGVVYSDLKYKNSKDELVVHRIPASTEVLTLSDFPMEATFDIRTAFLPDTLALDTFFAEFESLNPVFEEIEMDKSLWENAELADDTYDNTYRPLNNLWTTGATSYFRQRSNVAKLPNWVTIDLGKRYIFGKMLVNQYTAADNWMYNSGAPRIFEIWGSNEKSTDWNDWTLLGEFESHKPSGLPTGQLTAEDRARSRAGEEFEFERSNQSYQYVRFKTLDTWGGGTGIMLLELTLWGQTVN